jgi:hypothetical protein
MFYGVDRFAEKSPSMSPFHYASLNPMSNIDVNGDSTFVVSRGNGIYEVNGGNLDGNDKGIYLQDDKGNLTGEKIGESLTTHSFVDANDKFVKGALINTSSSEGQDFIDNEIIKDDPFILAYMWNARNDKDLDFKTRNEDQRGDLTVDQYRYRGSVTSNGKIGSARDFGNMAAGIVAGRFGLSWKGARMGFDLYQGGSEPKVTQLAERHGFLIGQKLGGFSEKKYNGPGSGASILNSMNWKNYRK